MLPFFEQRQYKEVLGLKELCRVFFSGCAVDHCWSAAVAAVAIALQCNGVWAQYQQPISDVRTIVYLGRPVIRPHSAPVSSNKTLGDDRISEANRPDYEGQLEGAIVPDFDVSSEFHTSEVSSIAPSARNSEIQSTEELPEPNEPNKSPRANLLRPEAESVGRQSEKSELVIPESRGESHQQESTSVDLRAAWWFPEQATKSIFADRNHLPLSLGEALARTLENSPNIAVRQATLDIQQWEVRKQSAAFDWASFINSRWDDRSDPVGSTLSGVQNRLRDDNWTGRVGVRNDNRIGGQFELYQDLGHQNTN